MHLGEVDVTRADAGHRVGLAGGGLRRAEAEVVEGRIEIRAPRGDGEADALHENGVLLVATGPIGATDDRGRGAVGRRAAVEEAERPGDDRGLQNLLGGNLHAEMRLVVQRSVVVVLDRHPGERLAAEPEGMHVAVGRECEEAGRRVASREQRMAEARDAAAAAVLQLLGAEDQHDVRDARGHGEAAVPEGVGAGRAVILDAGDGTVVEPERVAERYRRLAAARARQVRAEVRRLDLGGVDAGVGIRVERGVGDELLVAPLEAIAELRAADADDRHLVLHTGRAFQK